MPLENLDDDIKETIIRVENSIYNANQRIIALKLEQKIILQVAEALRVLRDEFLLYLNKIPQNAHFPFLKKKQDPKTLDPRMQFFHKLVKNYSEGKLELPPVLIMDKVVQNTNNSPDWNHYLQKITNSINSNFSQKISPKFAIPVQPETEHQETNNKILIYKTDNSINYDVESSPNLVVPKQQKTTIQNSQPIHDEQQSSSLRNSDNASAHNKKKEGRNKAFTEPSKKIKHSPQYKKNSTTPNANTKNIKHEKKQRGFENIETPKEIIYSDVNKQNRSIPKDAERPVQEKFLGKKSETILATKEQPEEISAIYNIGTFKTPSQFKSETLPKKQVADIFSNEMKCQHDEPFNKNKQYQEALDKHHKTFVDILERITPLKYNKEIAGHKKLERCLSTLYQNLFDVGKLFFKANNIDADAFKTFESSCEKQINLADLAFNHVPGFWNDYLRPVLMGILGVVVAVTATLLTAGILPILVACNSERRSDYTNKFFKCPTSLKKSLKWRELRIKDDLLRRNKEKPGLIQDIEDLIQQKVIK